MRLLSGAYKDRVHTCTGCSSVRGGTEPEPLSRIEPVAESPFYLPSHLHRASFAGKQQICRRIIGSILRQARHFRSCPFDGIRPMELRSVT